MAVAAAHPPWACTECGAPAAPFVCGRCHGVRFCTPRCQRAGWPQHRGICCEAGETRAPSSTEVALAPTPSTSGTRRSLGTASGAVSSAGSGSSVSVAACAAIGASVGAGGEWLALPGVDAFPGEDAGPALQDVEAAKKCCEEQCFGGFVTWRGRAFLRARPTQELLANARQSMASTLWLPAATLTAAWGSSTPSRGFRLADSSAEVMVPGASPVDKCAGLSEADMTQRFVASRPVVITDAQEGWPARSKWTFQWLAEHYGDEEMPISDLAPFFRHCDRGKIQTVKVSMREYMRYVLGEPNGVRALQRTDDRVFYGNGWCPFMQHEHLLEDVSDRLYCVRDAIPRGNGPTKEFNNTLTKVFVGPAGTVSRLHHDTYATHVWLSQIRGRKQFICFPPDDAKYLHCHVEDDCDGRTSSFDPSNPDYDAFPEARNARPFSVVVEEGETVVLPSRWWHWAKSLTPSVTLMRNFVNEVNMKAYMEIQERATRMKAMKQQQQQH